MKLNIMVLNMQNVCLVKLDIDRCVFECGACLKSIDVAMLFEVPKKENISLITLNLC